MLDESEEIIALARSNTDPFAGKLKVALIPTIGPYLLPRVMRKIRKALPQLAAHALRIPNRVAAEAPARRRDRLRNHGAAGAAGRPGVARPVRGVVSPWRSPTIIRSPQKSPSRYRISRARRCCSLEDGHCLRDQALEVCSRIDVREAEDFRATSLETLRQMVVAGLGITLLPEMAVESPLRVAARPDYSAIQQPRAVAHCRRRVAQVEHTRRRRSPPFATSWIRCHGVTPERRAANS